MAQAAKSTRFVLALVLASTGAAMVTFLALVNPGAPFGRHPERLWMLLLLDVALLVVIGGLIARQLGSIWATTRSGMRKSKLQRRIVRSFCIVTALPTVVVSIFSIVFFNLGIQAWFNDRVSTVVNESLAVAEAYLDEHKENIRVDALALADDINHFAGLAADPLEFNRFVSEQAARRRLTEVVVFQGNHIIAQGRLSFTIAFESLPQELLTRAAEGEVVILPATKGSDEDRVRALVRLDGIENGFLLVGRLIDEKVIGHMERTQGAVNEYQSLKSQLVHLQWTFSAVFVMLTLVLLLAAIWYGLMLAARLTTPVMRLAVAAERVRAGDYTGRVEVGSGADEISVLSRTFNRMTDQLDQQRGELIEANRQLDERRRFTEAVLGGVSAGVLALDANRRVTLCNRSAAALLQDGDTAQAIEGRHVNEVLPGIQELLTQAEAGHGELTQGSITLGTGANAHTLHVRVVVSEGEGAIVTFDDITPLVAAQRNAAWSDVARRVAHEIKNPLTPIALSAERLKRKYLSRMEGEEAEHFSKYVDTIARHVGDIGRMVEEFVSFARMPGAVMTRADLLEIVRKEVFSEQVAHPNIQYRLTCAEDAIPLVCDERQLSQVFINVLKNAAEAIEDVQAHSGEISVTVTVSGREMFVVVEDNGPGFPPEKIHAILEPYVTTRTKGTGLGLAIVKKIMEENNGNIQVANRPEGGARVTLSFLQQRDINASANL